MWLRDPKEALEVTLAHGVELGLEPSMELSLEQYVEHPVETSCLDTTARSQLASRPFYLVRDRLTGYTLQPAQRTTPMGLIDVRLTEFLANFVTLDEHPKTVESLSPTSAVLSCPDCTRRVEVVTSALASTGAINYVADGATLHITANATPDYAQATQCADRVWEWLIY